MSAALMTVKFETWREDFPPNIEDLKIEHVLLFFCRAADDSTGEQSFEVDVQNLWFIFTNEEGKKVTVGGATTIDSVISTRRGNGSAWTGMIGKPPAGEWELVLPPDRAGGWFQDEKIEDILLVITYRGRTPA